MAEHPIIAKTTWFDILASIALTVMVTWLAGFFYYRAHALEIHQYLKKVSDDYSVSVGEDPDDK